MRPTPMALWADGSLRLQWAQAMSHAGASGVREVDTINQRCEANNKAPTARSASGVAKSAVVGRNTAPGAPKHAPRDSIGKLEM